MKVFRILINSLIKENFYEKKKNNNILTNFFFTPINITLLQ